MIEAAVRFCADFYLSPRLGRSLVLVGNNGVGKTHCLSRVVAWARFSMRTTDIEYRHWPSFLDRLKAGHWQEIEDIESVELLALDEIGGGHDPSRVGADKLCRLLSRREKRWNIITTNLVPEAWDEAFDRRVASRLARNSEIIMLTDAPDYSL